MKRKNKQAKLNSTKSGVVENTGEADVFVYCATCRYMYSASKNICKECEKHSDKVRYLKWEPRIEA